jgi:hypothetical protein
MPSHSWSGFVAAHDEDATALWPFPIVPVGGKNRQRLSHQRGSAFELSVCQCPAHARLVDERDHLGQPLVKVRNDERFACQLDGFVVLALKAELVSA